MNVQTVTPWTKLPLSLADAKQAIGVSSDDWDDTVESYVRAGTDILIERTHRAYSLTTLDYFLNRFPLGMCIEIPYPPLASITSFDFYDGDDNQQSLVDGTDYQLVTPDGVPAQLWPAPGTNWPDVNSQRIQAIQIRYDAGSDDEDQIPDAARLFLSAICRFYFDNPDGFDSKPLEWTKLATYGMDSLVRSLSVGTYVEIGAYD